MTCTTVRGSKNRAEHVIVMQTRFLERAMSVTRLVSSCSASKPSAVQLHQHRCSCVLPYNTPKAPTLNHLLITQNTRSSSGHSKSSRSRKPAHARGIPRRPDPTAICRIRAFLALLLFRPHHALSRLEDDRDVTVGRVGGRVLQGGHLGADVVGSGGCTGSWLGAC